MLVKARMPATEGMLVKAFMPAILGTGKSRDARKSRKVSSAWTSITAACQQ
jgi:hypothetical protein